MALAKDGYSQVGTPRIYVDYVQYAKAIGAVWRYETVIGGIPVISPNNSEINEYVLTVGNGELRISNFNKVVGIQLEISAEIDIIENLFCSSER